MLRRLNNWYAYLALIVVGGLALRIAGIYIWYRHPYTFGDAFYYHEAANLLAEGHGFVDPVTYILQPHHQVIQGADFPPLYTLYLSVASYAGYTSYFAHQVWTCLLGAATAGLVGFAGREVGGRRVGIVAAFIAAFYPNFWMNDLLVHSETLSMFMIAAVVLVSFKMWHRPRLLTAAVLGFVIGVAALARDELLVLVPVLLIPLALVVRSEGVRVALGRRLKLAAISLLAVLVAVAPWSAFNLTRFQHPEFISTGLGVTLATANCNATYHGRVLGYWSLPCSYLSNPSSLGDESAQDLYERNRALHYVSEHEGQAAVVALARIGRTFGLYAPIDQIKLDTYVEKHPYLVGLAGLSLYYVFSLASIAGAVVLWRRRVTLLPFGAILVTDIIATVISFGQTRYRAPMEVVLAILTGVAFDALLARWWPSRQTRAVRAPVIEPADMGLEPSLPHVPSPSPS